MVFVAQYVPLDFKDAAIELAEYCLAFEIRRKSTVFLNSSINIKVWKIKRKYYWY